MRSFLQLTASCRDLLSCIFDTASLADNRISFSPGLAAGSQSLHHISVVVQHNMAICT